MSKLEAKLLALMVDLAIAGVIAYKQMPSDQQQRIRMKLYYRASIVCHHVGYRIARLEVNMHERYVKESAGNG